MPKFEAVRGRKTLVDTHVYLYRTSDRHHDECYLDLEAFDQILVVLQQTGPSTAGKLRLHFVDAARSIEKQLATEVCEYPEQLKASLTLHKYVARRAHWLMHAMESYGMLTRR